MRCHSARAGADQSECSRVNRAAARVPLQPAGSSPPLAEVQHASLPREPTAEQLLVATDSQLQELGQFSKLHDSFVQALLMERRKIFDEDLGSLKLLTTVGSGAFGSVWKVADQME